MTRMTGAHFRALRTYLGFSVREIANRLGVSQNSARDWDKGAYSPPAGVVAELEELQHQTDQAVTALADHYTAAGGPMVIPRVPADLPWEAPGVQVPDRLTLDWWKIVGMRVCDQVPDLRLEWPHS